MHQVAEQELAVKDRTHPFEGAHRVTQVHEERAHMLGSDRPQVEPPRGLDPRRH